VEISTQRLTEINQSINHSLTQSINQSINQSISKSVKQTGQHKDRQKVSQTVSKSDRQTFLKLITWRNNCTVLIIFLGNQIRLQSEASLSGFLVQDIEEINGVL